MRREARVGPGIFEGCTGKFSFYLRNDEAVELLVSTAGCCGGGGQLETPRSTKLVRAEDRNKEEAHVDVFLFLQSDWAVADADSCLCAPITLSPAT